MPVGCFPPNRDFVLGDCGSPLFKITRRVPELNFLMVGSLVEPLGFEISRDMFESDQKTWDHP